MKNSEVISPSRDSEPREEVVGAADYFVAPGVGESAAEEAELVGWEVVVVVSEDEQLGLEYLHTAEGSELGRGTGYRGDGLGEGGVGGGLHGDRRAEAVSGDSQAAAVHLVAQREGFERGVRVVGLAAAVVERALAVSDAAKVEPQYGEAGPLISLSVRPSTTLLFMSPP